MNLKTKRSPWATERPGCAGSRESARRWAAWGTGGSPPLEVLKSHGHAGNEEEKGQEALGVEG